MKLTRLSFLGFVLLLMCSVFLSSGLLVFSPSIARADGVLVFSDELSVFFATTAGVIITNESRTLNDNTGESVTSDIVISIPKTDQFDAAKNNSVNLVEPGTVTGTNSDGTVNGHQSDEVKLSISSGPNQTTELHITINSDEDPGRSNVVTGLLETGLPQDITTLLFGSTLTDSGFTATVTVASDAGDVGVPPPVPEPASMLLLGSGLLGLAGFARRRMKK